MTFIFHNEIYNLDDFNTSIITIILDNSTTCTCMYNSGIEITIT